jgi:hypothetical protein
MSCPAGPVVLKANQMLKPYISLFHHRGGVSVAVLHAGQDATKYWIDTDGHEPADAEEYIESADLPEPYASAPELLAALKLAAKKLPAQDSLPFRTETEIGQIVKTVYDAINKAEGKSDESS